MNKGTHGIKTGGEEIRSRATGDDARDTGFKTSDGTDIGELNRSTEYIDNRIANCAGIVPTSNCNGDVYWTPANGNWWTWGATGVPTSNCANNASYDGAGGTTSTLTAVTVETVYGSYAVTADEIGGQEQTRTYNNCNCGTFNCRTNCNCNCACACDCACACGTDPG